MAAPLGNQNAKGKNSGRKSAYQELQDATLLNELWEQPHTFAELEAKIGSGRYSIKEMFLYKAHAGHDKILRETPKCV